MDNCFLISFLLLNTLFWSFFPHIAHCQIFNSVMGKTMKCPPHYIHLMMGFVFYLLTMYYTQQKYLHTL